MRNVGQKRYIKVPRLCLTSDVKEVFELERTSKTKEPKREKKDWKALFIVKRRISESPIATQTSQNGLAFIFMVGDASHLGEVGRK